MVMLQHYCVTVPRAIDELSRGRGLVVRTNHARYVIFPAEFLSTEVHLAFGGAAKLLITAARAKSLGIIVSSDAAALDASALSFEQIMSAADPTFTTNIPSPNISEHSDYAELLRLVKYACLLPALLVTTEDIKDSADWVSLSLDDLSKFAHESAKEITETARAKLPLEGAEQSVLVSYREALSGNVHLALIIGDVSKQIAPLVRIHSSCVTGDILGSLRCDCGDQLQIALSRIIKDGAGILVYLHQEGRGIGITNKLRAYALQEKGFDTYDANLMLGFGEDERDFTIAASILKKLGINNVRLLTNNPEKLENLKKSGIAIKERISLVGETGRHNHDYIAAKTKKSGHLF